jgi:hypothetical protein
MEPIAAAGGCCWSSALVAPTDRVVAVVAPETYSRVGGVYSTAWGTHCRSRGPKRAVPAL